MPVAIVQLPDLSRLSSAVGRGKDPSSLAGVVAVSFLGVIIMLGGGGSPNPLPELILQLITAALLAAWAVTLGARAYFKRPPAQLSGPAILFAVILFAIPLIQLLPLPPILWHALPGRAGERAALALIGQQDSWRPLTISPARTIAAGLALIVPLIAMVMVASLGRAGRAMIMGVIAGVALLSLVLGAAQMSGGNGNWLRFYVPDQPFLSGFQANRNSSADLLLVGYLALSAVMLEWIGLRRTRAEQFRWPLVIAAPFLMLVLGIVLTGSRAGMMLVPLVVIAQLGIFQAHLALSRRVGLALLGIVTAGAVLPLLLRNSVIAGILARYDFAGEFRPELWKDSLYSLGQYWPFGAGLGNFVPVFLASERLEVVDPTVPNRAHNDFLEFAIEAGLPGTVVLAICAAILIGLAHKHWRSGVPGARVQVWFGGVVLAVLGLHSMVDYPLRSMSLAAIAAISAAMLMPMPHRQSGNSGSKVQ